MLFLKICLKNWQSEGWMLDAGFWILDTGFWILDTGYSILDSGYWMSIWKLELGT
jgi:hypothetical protein